MAETIVEVKEILSKFAKNRAGLTDAGAASNIRKDLGVSSSNLVDVLLEFEDRFNISISDEELVQIETVGDAVRVIEAKKGAA